MPDIFGLYVVLTDPLAGYEKCTEAAVVRGVRYVQLRMKGRPRREVVATAKRLRSITRGSRTLLVVNDDVQAAAESDADGVHLGQDDMPLEQARLLWLEPNKVFGLSTHDEEQEHAARLCSPDYVGVGPVYPTPSKACPDPVLGLPRAAAIARSSPLTTVAIGGIDAGNANAVLTAGLVNVAVLRAVCRSDNPRSAIEALQRALTEDHPTQRA